MSKKKKDKKSKTAEEPEIIEPETYEEEMKTNLIYNFFNFFIGGDNQADIKNKQTGKPNPPY